MIKQKASLFTGALGLCLVLGTTGCVETLKKDKSSQAETTESLFRSAMALTQPDGPQPDPAEAAGSDDSCGPLKVLVNGECACSNGATDCATCPAHPDTGTNECNGCPDGSDPGRYYGGNDPNDPNSPFVMVCYCDYSEAAPGNEPAGCLPPPVAGCLCFESDDDPDVLDCGEWGSLQPVHYCSTWGMTCGGSVPKEEATPRVSLGSSPSFTIPCRHVPTGGSDDA